MVVGVFKSAGVVSIIIGAYAIFFHAINVSPNNWNAMAIWLPIYISPIWGIAGASWYSERRIKNGDI